MSLITEGFEVDQTIYVDLIIRRGAKSDLAASDLNAPRVIFLTDTREFIVSRGDGTYENVTEEINNHTNVLATVQEVLNTKASVAWVSSIVGSPLVASTAAAMTDTSRIYVYTGNQSGYTAGNWYYFNGTAWVSGGVYNAVAVNTDKTLSVEDQPADAKKTGDEITNVKSHLEAIGFTVVDGAVNITYEEG